MSSVIFNQAKRMHKEAQKYVEMLQDNPYTTPEQLEEAYDRIINHEISEFKKILIISKKLTEAWKEVSELTNQYFITIRPNEKVCSFIEFYNYTLKFIKRKCIEEYTLSFEQKGTTEETLGQGFHCHIVCKAKWRSKGECLRDTKSTFNKICEPQCIQVDVTRNPNDIIKNYLIEYKSDDGHKEVTQKWDNIWRQRLSLRPIYTSNDISISENPIPDISVTEITPNKEKETSVYQVQKTEVKILKGVSVKVFEEDIQPTGAGDTPPP